MYRLLEESIELGRKSIGTGQLASYIPELTKADPDHIGVSVRSVDGRLWHAGDYEKRFTMQSISKIASLLAAFDNCGTGKVFSKVGMEPSGEAFNAFADLAITNANPTNPMINAGALTVAWMLTECVTFDEMLGYVRKLCMDPEIDLDEDVFQSEMNNSARNHSIAYLLKSTNVIEGDVEKTLDLYTRMCSLRVTSDSLANFASVLACDGSEPVTGERFMTHQSALLAKTIMLTCGMYDGSGEFAVRVGVPAKSGVGGGLMAVSDRRLGIGIFGPELDKKGNSVAGQKILENLSKELDLHLFGRSSSTYVNRYELNK